MAGYRSAFIRTTRFLSAALPMEGVIGMTGQRLVVPVYHLVSNEAPKHVKHLYQVKDEKQFIRDLDFLLGHYQAIDFHELKTIVDNGKKINKNSFLLSFDDGLREFHDVIAPILLKKGIPAVNFLNNDFIDNRELFFRYKASLLIDCLLHDSSLLKKDDVKGWLSEQTTKHSEFKHVLLSVGFRERDKLDVLARMIGLDFEDYLGKSRPYMSQEEIRKLISQGFFFGAHSLNHPEYRFINMKEQLEQTRDSLNDIAERFALNYRTFAFPFTDFGVGKTFFESLNSTVKVDLTFGSAGLKNDPVPNHIQRIPLETAGLDAEQILKGEYLYYLIRGLFGKNKIRRA
jgi:peptidoglycan/xylan/chitin deacetylase (PgdA/CDA1 family)